MPIELVKSIRVDEIVAAATDTTEKFEQNQLITQMVEGNNTIMLHK